MKVIIILLVLVGTLTAMRIITDDWAESKRTLKQVQESIDELASILESIQESMRDLWDSATFVPVEKKESILPLRNLLGQCKEFSECIDQIRNLYRDLLSGNKSHCLILLSPMVSTNKEKRCNYEHFCQFKTGSEIALYGVNSKSEIQYYTSCSSCYECKEKASRMFCSHGLDWIGIRFLYYDPIGEETIQSIKQGFGNTFF